MDIQFTLQSTSDGSILTGKAASTTVYISKDGAAFSASTNSAAEIGRGLYKVTLTSAESEFTTLYYQPVCSGAQTNMWSYDAPVTMPTVPTAAQNAAAVWDAQTKIVNIDSTQIATLATANALTTVGNNVSAVKAKTDNLPSSPAAVGSAMTLTSAYDAAKTAAQAGSEMALTSAAVTAVQNGLATSSDLSALETHGDSYWHTASTAGLATGQGLENLATYGDLHWSTANVSGLATTAGLESLATYGDAHWTTADVSGLAEKTDIPTDYAKPTDIPTSDIAAIKTKVDSLHNADLSGVATALSVEKIHAGLFNWSLDEDVINAKNTSGTVIVSSTITRDSSGNITAMEEGND